jgi:hypothetical protein
MTLSTQNIHFDNNIKINTFCNKINDEQNITSIKIETNKERRDIKFVKNINLEHLKSTINNENRKCSYNAIIVTSDKKIILCARQKSFYYDIFITMCKNIDKIMTYDEKKEFMKLFANLLFMEKKKILNIIYKNYEAHNSLKIKKFILKNFNNDFINEIINENDLSITHKEYNLYSEYTTKYIKDLPINDCTVANIILNNNYKFEIKKYSSLDLLMLPGGKNNNSTENIIKILNREIYEEIGLDNILSHAHINTYYIENVIYDKILNKTFIDNTFIIITNIHSRKFCTLFNKNVQSEVKNLLFVNIPNIPYDKLLFWIQMYLII